MSNPEQEDTNINFFYKTAYNAFISKMLSGKDENIIHILRPILVN